MIEIEELSDAQIRSLLQRVGYGHLACSRDNRPYLIPVHFAYDEGAIVVYTTEGKKSQIIDANPYVCLQVEEVEDNSRWESVIVDGNARRVTDEAPRRAALELITEINPTLTPAVSIRWLDNWVRENIEVIYRIEPEFISGRRSKAQLSNAGTIIPGGGHSKDTIF